MNVRGREKPTLVGCAVLMSLKPSVLRGLHDEDVSDLQSELAFATGIVEHCGGVAWGRLPAHGDRI